MFDKFHEECGVVAIYGHPEAAKLAYLGLYALQHRGQESAGICTSDGDGSTAKKSMGHVADIFTPHVLETLAGRAGHRPHALFDRRRHGAAQRAAVFGGLQQGRIAVAHNGNITNAAELRQDLEREGPFSRRRATPK